VEENLAFVLEGLLRHRRFGLVATGFGAIRSFESKLNMVDEIARRALGKRQLKRWNSLKGRLNKKYSKRNEVAHFSVLFHVNVREARLYPYWGITKGKPLVSRAEGLTAKDFRNPCGVVQQAFFGRFEILSGPPEAARAAQSTSAAKRLTLSRLAA
jgi:hypothetical protein